MWEDNLDWSLPFLPLLPLPIGQCPLHSHSWDIQSTNGLMRWEKGRNDNDDDTQWMYSRIEINKELCWDWLYRLYRVDGKGDGEGRWYCISSEWNGISCGHCISSSSQGCKWSSYWSSVWFWVCRPSSSCSIEDMRVSLSSPFSIDWVSWWGPFSSLSHHNIQILNHMSIRMSYISQSLLSGVLSRERWKRELI